MSIDLDLSRRAVAAGWKWQRGCRIVNSHVAAGTVLDGGEDYAVWYGEGSTRDGGGYQEAFPLHSDLLPDFRDAATRGVLLQQVRERWDDPWLCVAWTGTNVYGWVVRDRDGKMLVWGHDSETAALVAAMGAAPKR